MVKALKQAISIGTAVTALSFAALAQQTPATAPPAASATSASPKAAPVPKNGQQTKTVYSAGEKPPVKLSPRAELIREHTTWAYPMFNAGPTQVKEITQIDRFPYVEQTFQPAFTIEAQPQGDDRFTSPEEAMISRTSEMMHADYDAWMGDWDAPSRVLTEKIETLQKTTRENRVQMWKAAFSTSRFTLAHRIQTGPYVILTYHLTRDGRPVVPAEFPVIFHLVEGRWDATQDLSKDPLPSSSPWMTGQDKVEVQVRPLPEEKTTVAQQQSAPATPAVKAVSR
jgi:hypothetical protein